MSLTGNQRLALNTFSCNQPDLRPGGQNGTGHSVLTGSDAPIKLGDIIYNLQNSGIVQIVSKTNNSTSIGTDTYGTLMSQSITTSAGSSLIVHLTASFLASASGRGAKFRVSVDGVVKCGATGGTNASSVYGASVAAICKVDNLSAGSHTVLVEWAATTSGITISIGGGNDFTHSTLLIQEVAS